MHHGWPKPGRVRLDRPPRPPHLQARSSSGSDPSIEGGGGSRDVANANAGAHTRARCAGRTSLQAQSIPGRPTFMSASRFVVLAVPRKATTTRPSPQPIRHRVSCRRGCAGPCGMHVGRRRCRARAPGDGASHLAHTRPAPGRSPRTARACATHRPPPPLHLPSPTAARNPPEHKPHPSKHGSKFVALGHRRHHSLPAQAYRRLLPHHLHGRHAVEKQRRADNLALALPQSGVVRYQKGRKGGTGGNCWPARRHRISARTECGEACYFVGKLPWRPGRTCQSGRQPTLTNKPPLRTVAEARPVQQLDSRLQVCRCQAGGERRLHLFGKRECMGLPTLPFPATPRTSQRLVPFVQCAPGALHQRPPLHPVPPPPRSFTPEDTNTRMRRRSSAAHTTPQSTRWAPGSLRSPFLTRQAGNCSGFSAARRCCLPSTQTLAAMPVRGG